jgi:two-component system sensor kinase FixL
MSQVVFCRAHLPAEDPIERAVPLMPHADDALLSRVLDMAGEAIVVLDGQGRITAFGAAGEPLLGWTAGDVLGRPFAMLLADEAAGTLHNAFGSRDTVARHRHGADIPVRLDLAAVGTGEAGPRVAVLRARNTVKAGEALSGASDAMGPVIAHELSQPLTATALYLRAAESLVGAAGPAATFIAKARREAERAGGIIRGLRRFAANRPPETRPVPFDTTIDEAVDLAMVGRDRQPVILRERGEHPLRVVADPVQLQQIVVNIVRNGIEAAEGRPNPRLWITTRQEGGTVVLAVRDSGPGMSAEVSAGLFAPFRTSKPAGLGLGLALSRGLAERHGGSITIDPGGAGQGATVSLVLPLAPPGEPRAVQRSP